MNGAKLCVLILAVLLLAGCSAMTGGGAYTPPATQPSAATSRPPAVCRDLLAMDLETVKEIIDNAMSPNGQVNDGDTPLTAREVSTFKQDAKAIAALTATPGINTSLEAVLQAEQLILTQAAGSPNGTVTNDQAIAEDNAYKGITAECPS